MFLSMKTIETMKILDMLHIDNMCCGSMEDWAREIEELYLVAVCLPFAVGTLHPTDSMLAIVPVGCDT